MKYLCLGYGDKAKMDALPKEELKTILRQCVPFVEELNTCKGMILHEALSWDVTTLRSSKGKVAVTDGPFAETKEQIGSFFVFEARDLDEAISVASKHPSARMGAELAWRIELRAVGEFKPE
jgi:hypothetical protein